MNVFNSSSWVGGGWPCTDASIRLQSISSSAFSVTTCSRRFRCCRRASSRFASKTLSLSSLAQFQFSNSANLPASLSMTCCRFCRISSSSLPSWISFSSSACFALSSLAVSRLSRRSFLGSPVVIDPENARRRGAQYLSRSLLSSCLRSCPRSV